MEGILARVNIRVLKEPRGFMKVLEFVFSICAFATTTSYSSSFVIDVSCLTEGTEATSVKGVITYPFQVDRVHPSYNVCNIVGNLSVAGDFSSDAKFFVAVGVLALLYVLVAIVLYCYFNALYENNDMVPIADFAVHVLFVILWFAASCAWANSLDGLRNAASLDNIIKFSSDCNSKILCTKTTAPRFGKLISSVIFGFLNVFLWGSNLWFLYKETRFYKDRKTEETQNPAI